MASQQTRFFFVYSRYTEARKSAALTVKKSKM